MGEKMAAALLSALLLGNSLGRGQRRGGCWGGRIWAHWEVAPSAVCLPSFLSSGASSSRPSAHSAAASRQSYLSGVLKRTSSQTLSRTVALGCGRGEKAGADVWEGLSSTRLSVSPPLPPSLSHRWPCLHGADHLPSPSPPPSPPPQAHRPSTSAVHLVSLCRTSSIVSLPPSLRPKPQPSSP